MSENWFRGEAAGGPVSSAGGSIHDFGDGTYLTDSFAVAKLYAQTRTSDPTKQVVLSTTLDTASLGRVLDLRTDARWADYFKGPGGQQALDIIKTGRMNEMYGKTFESFLKHNNIDRNQYDAIIGPEYVRGGNQLCLVHKDGKPTPLVDKVRGTFKVVTSVPNGPSQPPIVPNKGMTKMPDLSGMPKSMGGRIMRNQNVAAAIGTALAGGIQWIGDKGIAMRIEDDLQTKYKAGIEAILKRGEGVLVIIHMKEWLIPDFNGMRGRMYLGISLSGGSSQEDAMANWKAVPRLLQGPGSGWRCYDNYAWIPPSL
ncbi:MAG TPA: hypothetical protein VL572_05040 [Pyrinomonadaceae bacterium]|nr:hypothetical protein [Pyrinomonadaceae bacterium]